ncbi:SGNH/GDSL hydrolase family protein [Lysobacter sp. cf310]|uniref:SGNH/GDSL hydrolase family protein n=1 Tax=Lysobacter sp. cf310 TaxID=1761790 RepID=UPI0008EE9B10|nr:SGNH/GDSL hydrolase family protein [Lysobacter sp. cf310]SFK97790.1 Lysophospholipase L1 [Lysobacter sp. cf310]
MHRLLIPLLLILLAACRATAPAAAASAPAPATPAPATAAAPNDWARFEPDIAAFEAEDSRVRRMPGAVVFVGSSSFRLWTTLHEDLPGIVAINRGYGGSRVYDSVHYADRIVTPYQPRAVVFYAGDNDLQEGRTPQEVAHDFAAFVQRARAAQPGLPIAFVSIKPSPVRAHLLPQVRSANLLIRDYAARHQVAYLDVYTPMLDARAQPREDLFVADRLHMNEKGYAIWAQVIGPWLRGL